MLYLMTTFWEHYPHHLSRRRQQMHLDQSGNCGGFTVLPNIKATICTFGLNFCSLLAEELFQSPADWIIYPFTIVIREYEPDDLQLQHRVFSPS